MLNKLLAPDYTHYEGIRPIQIHLMHMGYLLALPVLFTGAGVGPN